MSKILSVDSVVNIETLTEFLNAYKIKVRQFKKNAKTLNEILHIHPIDRPGVQKECDKFLASFGLTLVGYAKSGSIIIREGGDRTVWKYYDKFSLDGHPDVHMEVDYIVDIVEEEEFDYYERNEYWTLTCKEVRLNYEGERL